MVGPQRSPLADRRFSDIPLGGNALVEQLTQQPPKLRSSAAFDKEAAPEALAAELDSEAEVEEEGEDSWESAHSENAWDTEVEAIVTAVTGANACDGAEGACPSPPRPASLYK
eukprot:1220736-Prymnesium_polylepis.1